MRLVPCTACQRHADADAGPCPFCGGPLSVPIRRGPPKAFRLTRAAIFYFGLGACSGGETSEPPPPPPVEAPVANPYGAPVIPEEQPVSDDETTDSTADEQAAPEQTEAERREAILRTLRETTSAPAYGAPALPPE